MELMLNNGTDCLEVAFILKAMPKLNHLGVLFHELRMEGSRCLMWLANCFLLHHIHILAWIPFPICSLLRKNTGIDFLPVTLDSSWSRVYVISDGFSIVGINFLAICCFICGQAVDLHMHLVLGGLAKTQAQQAQIDLRRLC